MVNLRCLKRADAATVDRVIEANEADEKLRKKGSCRKATLYCRSIAFSGWKVLGVDGKMDCLMISGWVDVLRSAKVEWVSGGVLMGNSEGGGGERLKG